MDSLKNSAWELANRLSCIDMRTHTDQTVVTVAGWLLIPLLLLLLLFDTTTSQARTERPDSRGDITDRTDREDPRPEAPTDDEGEDTDESDEDEPECESDCDAEEDEETDEGSDNEAEADGPTITLQELGLLQLAAHDFFDVDRDTEIDRENGELDLSTLLDHGEENIILGGEPRNRENIILFTVSKDFADLYYHQISIGKSEYQAREATVAYYHHQLKKIYRKLFGENLPRPAEGEVTMDENLALRTIHDFLPGTIQFEGEERLTVDMDLFGKTLTHRELKQESSPLDGQLDEEFLDVVIFIPPDMIMHIDLLERDSSLAEQFETEHTFEHFMEELEDGSYDDNEDVTKLIKGLFAKGLHFEL